jgi:hypothetical protein
MTFPPMKQKNNNNNSKCTDLEIFPEDYRKCFFVLENELSDIERLFLYNQLRQRTNFNLGNPISYGKFGLEFLLWFVINIRPALSNFGLVLADSLRAKLDYELNKLSY